MLPRELLHVKHQGEAGIEIVAQPQGVADVVVVFAALQGGGHGHQPAQRLGKGFRGHEHRGAGMRPEVPQRVVAAGIAVLAVGGLPFQPDFKPPGEGVAGVEAEGEDFRFADVAVGGGQDAVVVDEVVGIDGIVGGGVPGGEAQVEFLLAQ